MDSESKVTADRHKDADRRPDGLADWREKYRAATRCKEKRERGRYQTEQRRGDEKETVANRKGDVFSGVRHHGETFSEGKQSEQMTGYGSCCHLLSDVKS